MIIKKGSVQKNDIIKVDGEIYMVVDIKYDAHTVDIKTVVLLKDGISSGSGLRKILILDREYPDMEHIHDHD